MELEESKMELEPYLTVFSTKLRVRTAAVLAGEKMTVKEIIDSYEKKYGESINRETVYRILESFVERDIAEKIYEETEKNIKYNLLVEKAVIDFVAERVIEKE